EGTFERREDLACGGDDVFRVLGVGREDGELIPAQPCDGVRRAKYTTQASRDLLEQAVAAVVPKRVVDVFEPVQVEQQHSEHLLVAPGGEQRLAQPVAEQAPVGQASQGVVKGLVLQRIRVRLAFRDVAQRRNEQVA